MARRYDELAEQLDELSLHFRLKERGRLARDCQLAASEIKQIDFLPPNPSELDSVSREVRDFVADFRAYGEIPKLVEMRKEHPYLSELTRISKVGPATAKQLHKETGVSTIEDVRELDNAGQLEEVSGIGPKTATTIRRSIAQLQ